MSKAVQVKSKKRIKDFGEVYTNNREVYAMVDLVSEEANSIESTFLEPACGTGNFLIEILSRKLKAVSQQYRNNRNEYEQYSILAFSSIYGIDIQQDNIFECRERLFQMFCVHYNSRYYSSPSRACQNAIKYILSKNILCGNSLKYIAHDGSPLMLSEWSMLADGRFLQREYLFRELVEKEIKTATVREYEVLHFEWIKKELK